MLSGFNRALTTAVFAGTMFAAAPASAAVLVPVWSTNFETNQVFQTTGPFGFETASFAAGGAAITNSQLLPGFGRRYLRNSTKGETSFSFTGLDPHEKLWLSFDIAFLDSWDRANDAQWGPDYLFVTTGGVTQQWGLNHAGQVNWPGTQIGRGNFAVNGSWQDSVHRFQMLIPQQSSAFTFSIRAGGKGYQGGNDESWGIDNISLVAQVPEPATWAMLIAGFGMVGVAIRRRRPMVAA
jgi:hypothetical protein